MNRVVVIGAGASGIIAALRASNNEVILIDGNDKSGKKLLITGNGKCNYWNENIDIKNYYSDDLLKLENILQNKQAVLDYLYMIGIYPKIKNGYYYPASGTSASIKTILDKELIRCNVKTMYSTKVVDIKKENDNYLVITEKETILANSVIIATGSKACPKTGSNGFGYILAKKFNHNINKVLPALVSLKTNDNSIKDWAGVRTDAKISLYKNDINIASEEGEIQLTEDGISGICTFNISGLVSKSIAKNESVKVKINFVPTIDSFYDFFDNRNNTIKNRTIEELLESILNYKLINVILKKTGIKKDSYWQNLNNNEKNKLINNIENFELIINSTNDFDKAQVCTGGISLSEVNENMESIYNKNLYFIGEILDVDGKCGGFNLAFAFISGYIAGGSI